MKLSILSPKKYVTMALLTLASLSAAGPASAVSFIREYYVTRTNDNGSTLKDMTLTSNTFCYLSQVTIENTDTEGEAAQCRVFRGGSVWILEAHLRDDNDADVACRAICYNN